MKNQKIVLGIDPGSRITGYGLVYKLKEKIIFLKSGLIKTKVLNFPNRLKIIYFEINKIIFKYKPSCFVIEHVFISKNADSAIKLGQAKGAAIVAAVNNNLPVFEYNVKQIKKIVVGQGNAKKKQVQNVVYEILKLVSFPTEDAADALAVAIAHCHLCY